MSRTLAVILLAGAVIATLPVWLPRSMRLMGLRPHGAPVWLPGVAAILFVGAFWLPDIHISPETQTFQQHFVGGGLLCAALYAYGRRLLGLQLRWWFDVLAVLALVSMLGVAAELAEFTLTHAGILNIDTNDTDWDLLANTIGTLTGWILGLPLRRAKPADA